MYPTQSPKATNYAINYPAFPRGALTAVLERAPTSIRTIRHISLASSCASITDRLRISSPRLPLLAFRDFEAAT